MSNPITGPGADRNLLFGILALQMDFIKRESLIAAMHAWVLAKTKPLGQILVEHKALAEERRSLLEALVQEHLKHHGNDPEKSLASVTAVEQIAQELKQIADPDVESSISRLPAPRVEEFATRAPSMVSASAGGATAPTPSLSTLSAGGLRYRIVRPHRKGGLGEVHVALDEELHREVALKEIQSHHADNLESRTRFLVEAEITGGLEHPGIVPVYGLGTYSGDGRPYYAMRFIRGESLKDAIDHFYQAQGSDQGSAGDPGEATLKYRQLLGRFVAVCQAIAYAHSRGIVHRDLKPANIMLGQFGETLVVDWGLAKPMDQAESPQSPGGSLKPVSLSGSSATLMGSAIGTPQFMSPEQAAGRLDAVGSASDVYSLGATLYCLLTGKPPFQDHDVGMVLDKVMRGEFPSPRQVRPEVAPPLEAICQKAMALKPEDRYASAQLLADDIDHWLADEPVSAWPEPWTVKARRWIGRHRTLVTSAAAVILVATVSLIAATVLLTAANERERLARAEAVRQERLAREQRDEARLQKEKAEQNFKLARQAVDRYHTEVSENVLLHEPGMEPLRKKLLEAAREFYQKFVQERKDDAGVQGELGKALYRLAQITGDIDSVDRAIQLHQEALEKFDALASDLPEYQSDRAACYHHLGRMYRLTDQTAKAETAYKQALTLWKELIQGHENEPRYQASEARSFLGLGNEYRLTGRTADAITNYQRALTIWTRLAGVQPGLDEYQRDLAVCHNNLAQVYVTSGEASKAETAFRDALKIQEHLYRDHANITQYGNDLARTQHNLATWYAQTGQSDKAEGAFKDAESVWSQLIKDHPAVTEFYNNLAGMYNNRGNVYRGSGKLPAAEDVYQKALAIEEKLVKVHPDRPAFQAELARNYYNLAQVYRADKKAAQAEEASQKALSMRESLARDHADIPQYQNDLAESYNDQGNLRRSAGQFQLAEADFSRAQALWKNLVRQHPRSTEYALGVAATCNNLGAMARDNGNFVAALSWYAESIQTVEPLSRNEHQQAEARQALAGAHWGRAATLVRLGKHAESIPDWDLAVQWDPRRNPNVRLSRALALARTGLHARAIREAGLLAALVEKATAGEVLYQLASVYALSATAVRNDMGAQDREQLAEVYTTRAVELLDRALAGGYFKVPTNRDRLLKDADFEPLRSRADFKKILTESEPKPAT